MIIYQNGKKYKVFFAFAAKGREKRAPVRERIVVFEKRWDQKVYKPAK